MAKLTMTPANKDWNKIPLLTLNRIKDMIAQACEKRSCTPDDLDIKAVFEDGVLQYVKTKPKCCKTCGFWDEYVSDPMKGDCQRYPPSVTEATQCCPKHEKGK